MSVQPSGEDPVAGIPALIERERGQANRIRVPETLRDPHPIIAQTRRALEGASPDWSGLVHPTGPDANECADIILAKASIYRGLRVMNALYRALEGRGHRVDAVAQPSDATAATTRVRCIVLGEEFRVRLREKTRRVSVKDGPKTTSRLVYPQPGYVATGILELFILESYGARLAEWKDSERHKVEDHLNQVVIAMLEAVGPRRRSREAQSRMRQDTLRAEEERKELDRLRTLELARVHGLEGLAERWENSQRLRAFIAAVREEAVRRHGSIDVSPDVLRWLEWAEGHVRSIDPLRAGQALPSMLSPGDPPAPRVAPHEPNDRCPRCKSDQGWNGRVCRRCLFGIPGR